MSDPMKVPRLYWEESLGEPGPMDLLNLYKSVQTELTDRLGREPTPEEHDAAYQEAMGKLAIEVTDADRQATIAEAERIIQELTEFLQQYKGEHHD